MRYQSRKLGWQTWTSTWH